jgi:hypothetical protein
MVNPWYDFSRTNTSAFAFTFTVGPQVKFCFDKVVSASASSKAAGNRPFKRRRPLWDVDGSTSEGKKKRRLLRFLITSPLSRPFSAPATNIVDRGISKIAWVKGRRLDKSLLRKAAIMNRVRSRLDAAKATAARRDDELRRQAVGSQQMMPAQRPRCYYAPRPGLSITMSPSPLVGVSNYDALDEDDMFECEDDDGNHAGYNWNIQEPCREVDEDEYDNDYLDELDGITHELAELPEERPPPPPDERIVKILREKETQKELVSCILLHSAGFVKATGSTFVGGPVGKKGSGVE